MDDKSDGETESLCCDTLVGNSVNNSSSNHVAECVNCTEFETTEKSESLKTMEKITDVKTSDNVVQDTDSGNAQGYEVLAKEAVGSSELVGNDVFKHCALLDSSLSGNSSTVECNKLTVNQETMADSSASCDNKDRVCTSETGVSIHNNDSGVFTDKSGAEGTSTDLLASDLDAVASLSSDRSKDGNDDDVDDDDDDDDDVYVDAEMGELGHGDALFNDSSSNSSSEPVESTGSASGENRSRRVMRRKQRVLSSSSDSDVDNGITGARSSKSPKSSGSDGEHDCTALTVRQNWFVLPELLQRERGYGNRKCTSRFRWSTYSSLNMVQRLKLHHKMDYHDGCVNALNFNRIGTLLASGSDDLNVCIWNWQERRPALTFDSGHRSNVFQTKFIPFSGDCHLVTSSRDGQIRLAELSLTGVCKSTKKLAQHRGSAHKLTMFTDDPHMVLSCGEDAAVFEIDLREQKPHKLILTKENDKKVALYSINANPRDSNVFCTGGRDHFIRIYDRRRVKETEDDSPLKKFCPHNLVNDDDVKANVTCAVFNYNGTEVLGTYNDEDIYLFDTSHSDGADYIHRYVGHRNNATVKEVNFYGPNSEYVISGSDCGNIYFWDKQTENIVQYMHADEAGVVNVLAPHPSLPILASSGLDHDVKVWTPSAYEPTKLVDLKKTTDRNKSDREEERQHQPEVFDSQMLWFLMHLRRSARRRAREEGEQVSSSSDDDSDDEDSDEEEEGARRLGCETS